MTETGQWPINTSTIPHFEDRYDKYGTTCGHTVTNEEIDLYRDKLLTEDVGRLGAIASGGEIILGALLQRSKEVVAIDHSYKALAAFWTKILLINHWGPLGAKKILTSHLDVLKKEASSVFPKMPSAVLGQQTPERVFSKYDAPNIATVWATIPDEVLIEASKRLNRLRIIHGDLTDLDGEFDGLYISNALEHTDRNGRHPDLKKVASGLKEGGICLLSKSASGRMSTHIPPTWKKLQQIKGETRTHSSAWIYNALRKQSN